MYVKSCLFLKIPVFLTQMTTRLEGGKLITDQYFPDKDIHAKYVQEIMEEASGKKNLIEVSYRNQFID